ncbi:unnamed protein product [Symbiodinium sp. KB8]|nr:unnamed protein product [Symbiodinium sp. KB8]
MPDVILEVKPFGKSGVRLCWQRREANTGVGETAKLVAEVLAGKDWLAVDEALGCSGVIVVRSLPHLPGTEPKTALWRLRCGEEASTPKAMPRVPPRAGEARRCKGVQLEDEDVEQVYNILQWYGTVVIDMREGDVERLAESWVCPDIAALAKLTFRDDALVMGFLPAEAEAVLQGRVRRRVYTVGSAVVEPLLRSFKVLSAPPVQKRPVLPNVIGARLVVGHQGHAAKLDEWSKHLNIIGVINLAPNVVPSKLDAIPDRAFYHEVWHSDAMPLWDTADDGRRLCDVLPETLAVIDRALGANPSGRVFIHCQQGRSRAASIAAAHLLTQNSSWNLFDAVSLVALRRPETEINLSYAESLEEFALSLGREPALDQVRRELPRHLRGGGVAQDWRDKMLDA